MLVVHFLNVGYGDCAIVEFQDTNRVMMVDINTSKKIDEDTVEEIYSCYEGFTKLSMTRIYFEGLGKDQSDLLKEAGLISDN